jgi:hypothetical protein
MSTQAAAVQNKTAFFVIKGVVTEARELVAKKSQQVWAYAIKLAGFGQTYEVTTKDVQLYKQCGVGTELVVRGNFESYNGEIKLNAVSLLDPKGAQALGVA